MNIKDRPSTLACCPLLLMIFKQSLSCVNSDKETCGLVCMPDNSSLLYFCKWSVYKTDFYKKEGKK